jgi:hypothetical protein
MNHSPGIRIRGDTEPHGARAPCHNVCTSIYQCWRRPKPDRSPWRIVRHYEELRGPTGSSCIMTTF